MNTFYKRAWEVLFILLYPFITLFSLLFIGLVSVISAISRFFAGAPEAAKGANAGASTHTQDWQPYVQHHGLFLSRKAMHQVQFGPMLYHFRTNPAITGLDHSYWSDFQVPIGEGFLLQRWPSIAEHELERFELVYVRPGLEEPLVLATLPTFYWQVEEHSHEEVDIVWTEEDTEKRLYISEETLP